MRTALALALAIAHPAASAQALAPTPAAPAVGFEQRLDASLPLAAAFVDSRGHAVRLRDELPPPGSALLLMLGYHRCPQLCGLATQGVLEAARQAGLAPGAARLVFVSVDPAETAADAADRLRGDQAYARLLAGAQAGAPTQLPVDRLVGPPASIAALAAAVGFTYRPGDATARFAHPAGVVVVTPEGRVSRYLMGVRFPAGDLRAAVDDARERRIGSPGDRLALLCAHFDPRRGVHSGAAMAVARVAGLAVLALLALFAWRHREAR